MNFLNLAVGLAVSIIGLVVAAEMLAGTYPSLITSLTTLNTSIYASYGKGGGSGPLGSTSRYYGNTDRTSDGLIEVSIFEK